MKTEEQIKGIKFEILLENLLKELGCDNVLRNVYCYKSRYRYRQVDISYNYVKHGRIYLAIIEAKYSSNGKVPYKLRSNKIKKEGNRTIEMENLVYEVRERRHFTNAGLALLVTNNEFEDKVKEEAKRYNIKVIEGKRLQELYHQNGHKGSIDDAIKSIDIYKRNLRRNLIRLY
ncbi:restriction endonuclease [Candidatus Woesearchaeota archaeon]|nr:restriction endonuclease [Candidatus Woesearchaeota archaeon]